MSQFAVRGVVFFFLTIVVVSAEKIHQTVVTGGGAEVLSGRGGQAGEKMGLSNGRAKEDGDTCRHGQGRGWASVSQQRKTYEWKNTPLVDYLVVGHWLFVIA